MRTVEEQLTLEKERASQISDDLATICFNELYDPEHPEYANREKEREILDQYILPPATQYGNPTVVDKFGKFMENKNLENLKSLFKNFPLEHLKDVDRFLGDVGRNLNLTKLPKLSSLEKSQHDLSAYMEQELFSGHAILSTPEGVFANVNSEHLNPNASYCVSSVGKVLTGVLAVKMMQEEILTPKMMNNEVQLDENVMRGLKEPIQKKLQSCTLHELMTHKSGLTDYLGNYEKSVLEGVKANSEIPTPEKPEDFLPFISDEVKDLEKDQIWYSNTGSLLTGLAIQHAYNTKNPDNPKSFNELLHKHVLSPAKASLDVAKPENGQSNPEDRFRQNLRGSPAGGYWMSAKSLHNVGQWLCEEWKNPQFRELTEKYGEEFYRNGEIHHNGGLQSSACNLRIEMDSGIVAVCASDRPQMPFRINRALVEQTIEFEKDRKSHESTMTESIEEKAEGKWTQKILNEREEKSKGTDSSR